MNGIDPETVKTIVALGAVAYAAGVVSVLLAHLWARR